jgi:hypothetical protein
MPEHLWLKEAGCAYDAVEPVSGGLDQPLLLGLSQCVAERRFGQVR